MAAREFTVSLLNNTPFRLIFRNEWLDHGEWSPGGFPPATIEPGTTWVWHAQSAGVATGVQGHVTYQVLDKDSWFGSFPGGHFGTQGCVMFHFSNPYAVNPLSDEKGPSIWPQFDACEGVLNSNASADYDWEILIQSQGEQGATTTEWVSWFTFGPAALWELLGSVSHAIVRSRISRKAGAIGSPLDSGLTGVPATPELVTRPVSGSAPPSWIGAWIDNQSSPTFRCNIAFTAPTPRGVPPAGRFDVKFHDSRAGVDIHNPACNIVNEPATPFTGDILPPLGSPVSKGTPLTPRAGGPSIDVGGSGPGSTERPRTDLGGPGVKADTIHLDPQNLLQLYGDFKPSGELVRNRVRCMRVLPDGKRLLDVMLFHDEPIR